MRSAPLCGALLAVAIPTAEPHDLYSHVFNRDGVRCCDETDCRPVHWRASPEGVRMFLFNSWILIPPERIVYVTLVGDTGETRGGHWCGDTFFPDAPYTRCAVLPPNFTKFDLDPLDERAL